jgi:hypothetical protein
MAPLSLQFGRPAALLWPAAWTVEAPAKTSVRAATVIVATPARIELTFNSFVS